MNDLLLGCTDTVGNQGDSFDYDCLYNPNARRSYFWGGYSNPNRYSTLSEFQIASNQELNGINQDPKFTDSNINNPNFTLQSDSLCIDRGVIIDGINSTLL